LSEIPQKQYYKIGEVCQYTDTQPYVLRFWESEFPQLAPEKNRSGQRVYRREDIDLVRKIKQLLYDEEYTIAGARKRLEDEISGETGSSAAKAPRVASGRGLTRRGADHELAEKIESLRTRLATAEAERDRANARAEGLEADAREARQEARKAREEAKKAAAKCDALRERCRGIAERLGAFVGEFGGGSSSA